MQRRGSNGYNVTGCDGKVVNQETRHTHHTSPGEEQNHGGRMHARAESTTFRENSAVWFSNHSQTSFSNAIDDGCCLLHLFLLLTASLKMTTTAILATKDRWRRRRYIYRHMSMMLLRACAHFTGQVGKIIRTPTLWHRSSPKMLYDVKRQSTNQNCFSYFRSCKHVRAFFRTRNLLEGINSFGIVEKFLNTNTGALTDLVVSNS